jgi:glycerol-3-phosphate O-acyltransferase/dihydroxyacetone phosphate acyltransferase
MLWHLLKYLLGFVIAVFFKKTKISNLNYLRVKGPIILAVNHPNGFMDPVALSTLTYPPRLRYLARGDAFKKGIITTILQSFGIIPIFRIQDGGKEGLLKNEESYTIVTRLLTKNKKIIIFAEGLCIQERRLRPLKKGVPRMIFSAMQNNLLDNLIVVPVGINYKDPSQFRGTIFCNIGKPIKMIDYMAAYNEAPAKTMNQFLTDLTIRMKELIVNINHPRSEKVIEHIEEIYQYDFFKKEKLDNINPEHHFLLSTKIAEAINRAEVNEPELVKSLYEKTDHYFSLIKKHNLRDWLINPRKQSTINYGVFVLRLCVIILSLPVYFIGLIASYLPYRITYSITSKKVKIKEFKASFYMGIGAFLFFIYYIVQFFVIKTLTPNILWVICILFLFVCSSIVCLHLSPFRKKTWGLLRLLKIKSNRPTLFEDLSIRRKDIIKLFEELI